MYLLTTVGIARAIRYSTGY